MQTPFLSVIANTAFSPLSLTATTRVVPSPSGAVEDPEADEMLRDDVADGHRPVGVETRA